MSDRDFPLDGGLYVLLLRVQHAAELRIGRLGTYRFDAGKFAYVGSARGPGGLSARLTRHLQPADQKRAHWHIDHLRAYAQIWGIGWSRQAQQDECEWSTALQEFGRRWPHRFGASDCRCDGHLIEFEDHITFKHVIEAVPEALFMRPIRI